MTRSTAAILILAALAAPALAQPAPAPAPPAPTAPAPTGTDAAPVARMKPPAGWTADDERAGAAVKALAAEAIFGDVPVSLDGQYLRSPAPGAILIATQVVTDSLPAQPAVAAGAALYSTREGADAVEGAKIVRWETRVDPAGRVHEALLEWTDPSVGATVIARTLVFRTGTAMARVAAECILGEGGVDQRPACEAALASLAPNTTALEPLAIAAPTPAAAPPPPAPSSANLPPPPTMGEHTGELPTTILVRPAPKKTDPRPFYVIGGLLLLGLAFWWNRRERQRRESELAREARGERPGGEPAERHDDDDRPASGKDEPS